MEKEYLRKQFADKLSSSKYDLNSLANNFMRLSMQYFMKGQNLQEADEYSANSFVEEFDNKSHSTEKFNVYDELVTLISSMLPSLVAPFHHYNNYIEYYCNDFLWDDIKYSLSEDEPRDTNVIRRIKYQMEVQSIFMSIKAGLDRFVSFFSYYYKGISPHTTFGRYKEEKGKFEGFMHTASVLKESDELMSFVCDEYFKWIKSAVAPRDTITHYNDLGIYYEFDADTHGHIPVHFDNRFIKEKGKEKVINTYSYENIQLFTERWLAFIEKVLSSLLNKHVIASYPKF